MIVIRYKILFYSARKHIFVRVIQMNPQSIHFQNLEQCIFYLFFVVEDRFQRYKYYINIMCVKRTLYNAYPRVVRFRRKRLWFINCFFFPTAET